MKKRIWFLAVLSLSALMLIAGCEKNNEETTASVKQIEAVTEITTAVTTTSTTTTTTTTATTVTTTVANANLFAKMNGNDFREYCSDKVEESDIITGQDRGTLGFKSELYPEYTVGYYGNTDTEQIFDVINAEEGAYLNNEIYVGMTYNEILEKADYIGGISCTTASIMRLAAVTYIDGVRWHIAFEFEDEEAFTEKLSKVNKSVNDGMWFTEVDPAEFNPKSTYALYLEDHYTRLLEEYVANKTASCDLDFYISPDENSRVAITIPENDQLYVDIVYDNGWACAKYKNADIIYSGYVRADSVKDIDTASIDWKEAYKLIFRDYENCGFGSGIEVNGQYLCDIDNDSVPELIVRGAYDKFNDFMIYTWNENDGLVCKGSVTSALGVMGIFNDDGTIAYTTLNQHKGECSYYSINISGSEVVSELMGSSSASENTSYDRANDYFEEVEFSEDDYSDYIDNWSN